MRRTAILALICLICVHPNAQDHDTAAKKMQIRGRALTGVLAGQSGIWPQLQLGLTVQKKRWIAGAGTGIDPYLERTIPLSILLVRNLGSRSSTPFVFAEGLYHWPWRKEIFFFEYDHRGGFGYEAGVGYRWQLLKKHRVILSAGYSYKPYSKKIDYSIGQPVLPRPSNSFQQHDAQFRRVAVKAGIEW